MRFDSSYPGSQPSGAQLRRWEREERRGKAFAAVAGILAIGAVVMALRFLLEWEHATIVLVTGVWTVIWLMLVGVSRRQ